MSCEVLIEDCLKQGELWFEPFTIEIDGEPIDLDGYTVTLVAVDQDDNEVINLSSDTGGITVLAGQVPDHIQPLLTTAQTAALNFKYASGDLRVINPAGECEYSLRISFQLKLAV